MEIISDLPPRLHRHGQAATLPGVELVTCKSSLCLNLSPVICTSPQILVAFLEAEPLLGHQKINLRLF